MLNFFFFFKKVVTTFILVGRSRRFILEKSIDVMHNAALFECMCSNDADQVFSVLNLGTASD